MGVKTSDDILITRSTAQDAVVTWWMVREIEERLRNPLPSFLGPREPAKPLPLRWRLRLRVMALRERIGFAIAGYTPPEDDW